MRDHRTTFKSQARAIGIFSQACERARRTTPLKPVLQSTSMKLACPLETKGTPPHRPSTPLKCEVDEIGQVMCKHDWPKGDRSSVKQHQQDAHN